MSSTLHSTMGRTRKSLGGDFPLEAAPEKRRARLRMPSGSWAVSGRAALALILQKHLRRGRFSTIHVPALICQSVVDTIEESGISYAFYDVGKDLGPRPPDDPNGMLLLVHYFGTRTLVEPTAKWGHIIEDFSMAVPLLLSGLDNKHDAFSSLRKFGPVPLGGWLNTDVELTPNKMAEELEAQSVKARTAKAAYLAESDALVLPDMETGYLNLLARVESDISKLPNTSLLPALSRSLVEQTDWPRLAERRRKNWHHLTAQLQGEITMINPYADDDDKTVPLGLVIDLGNKRDAVRQGLRETRIFCPVHWPLPSQIIADQFPQAASFCAETLTIPLDQRYSQTDMEWVAEKLLRLTS